MLTTSVALFSLPICGQYYIAYSFIQQYHCTFFASLFLASSLTPFCWLMVLFQYIRNCRKMYPFVMAGIMFEASSKRSSDASVKIVKVLAKLPPKFITLVKNARFPVLLFLWFSMIWSNLAMRTKDNPACYTQLLTE